LSLPASERHLPPNLSPQRKKELTLEALIRQLEGLARQQPVLTIFEDAHWADPTSRDLLDLTVERMRGLPVLLIVTFRAEFQPSWTGQSHVTALVLNRLDRRDQSALVKQIARGKALPDDVVAQIVDRTDGVPLFVEELTKSVLESGLLREEADRYALDGTLPSFAIPTTLHDSLMARLDRRAPKKNCKLPLLGSLPRSWCSSVEPRQMRSITSSTLWCRTRRTAACCGAHAGNCTRGSPKRSTPSPPR